jgi:hypothetical protein
MICLYTLTDLWDYVFQKIEFIAYIYIMKIILFKVFFELYHITGVGNSINKTEIFEKYAKNPTDELC